MSLFEALGGGAPAPDVPGGRTHLTDDEIVEVIRLYRDCSWRQVDIADHFNISQPFVSRIVNLKRRVPK